MIADLAHKPDPGHQGAAVMGEFVAGVQLLHGPDFPVHQPFFAAPVFDREQGHDAEQFVAVDIGTGADQFDAELEGFAHLFPAGKGVDGKGGFVCVFAGLHLKFKQRGIGGQAGISTHD